MLIDQILDDNSTIFGDAPGSVDFDDLCVGQWRDAQMRVQIILCGRHIKNFANGSIRLRDSLNKLLVPLGRFNCLAILKETGEQAKVAQIGSLRAKLDV